MDKEILFDKLPIEVSATVYIQYNVLSFDIFNRAFIGLAVYLIVTKTI